MNGWNGFNIGNLNTGPGGWPGYTANMPAPYMTPPGGAEVMNPTTPMGSLGPLAQVPGVQGAPGGWFGIDGLGKNLGTMQLGIGALGGLANIWQGFQQNKLAKASFNHQKGLLDTNLANQIKSFNLQLDDKLRSRQVVEGTSDASREEARKKWEARDERRG